MITKTFSFYVDCRFGFPVKLKDIPAINFNGEWIVEIDKENLLTEALNQAMLNDNVYDDAQIEFLMKWARGDYDNEYGVIE